MPVSGRWWSVGLLVGSRPSGPGPDRARDRRITAALRRVDRRFRR
ncbi:hypothetical protein V1L54_08460 [Streptomyces sp. TRM 70361]|nr:hypothetical protein [Streptomyces sp. TRM 70361]MEE1939447.1 hypothetical protein [Streptomyces sp. TRM 70361]